LVTVDVKEIMDRWKDKEEMKGKVDEGERYVTEAPTLARLQTLLPI